MSSPFAERISDPWNPAFVDLPSLNREASDALVERLVSVRQSARSPEGARSSVYLVLAPAGAGKTHLFARLRRSAGVATLVYVRPEIGVDPTPRALLAHAVDALAHKGADGESSQLELLVGSTLGALGDARARFPRAVLDELRGLDEPALDERIERALDRAESLRSDLELTWLDRLLHTPFVTSRDRRALTRWLSGREPDGARTAPHLPATALDEASIVPALRTLAFACSLAAPLVVVFDQLENLVDGELTATRVRAHARLVAELHDSVAGVTVVQLALDGEWLARIRPVLATSERARVEQRTLALALPTPSECRALVRLRFDAFREAHPSFDPESLPDPAALDSVCDQPGLTPRALFARCERVIAGDPEPAVSAAASVTTTLEAVTSAARADEVPDATVDSEDPLMARWAALVREAERELDASAREGLGVDRGRLASALRVGLRHGLGGSFVEPSARETHVLRWDHPGGARYVYALQSDNGRSLAAMAKHAIAHAESHPVLALRADGWTPPPSWKAAVAAVRELERCPRAAVMDLTRAAIARLFALHDLLAAARSGDVTARDGAAVTVEQVESWVARALALSAWEPLAALSSGEGLASARRAPRGPQQTLPVSREPALDALASLRVASIDRICRELRGKDASASRAAIVAALRGAGTAVRWLGPALVAWEGP